MGKFTATSFVSSLGKHNPSSLGKDIGINELLKYAEIIGRGKLDPSKFGQATKPLLNTETLVNVGVRVGSGIVAKLIENGVSSLSNKENARVPLISSNNRTPMGKSSASYQTTHVHMGCQTSERLKRIRFNPNIDYDEKVIASSDRDYQDHTKRKNLMLNSGFNEKGYTFFMEDTYFTVNDYLKFYKNQENIKKTIEDTKSKTDLYGCVYKTKNQFKFMNKFDFYNVSMRLHLIKLFDQHKDFRELIEDTTNNNTKIGMQYGKLIEDDQYSDADTKDLANKITTSFRTSLKCRLTDSIRFNDTARIVHTWERTLTPGSIWEFNLEHHLGKGIHLNQLYDFDVKNRNHPSGYCFILEYLGDRKGRIVRNQDGDFFHGYSPVQIHVEFEFKVGFLYEIKNNTEQPSLYRRKKNEADFEEGSEFESMFTPDREPSFHVSYDQIMLNSSPRKENYKYSLEYDINLMESSNVTPLLNKLQQNFKDAGLDETTVTEDDKIFNLRGSDPKTSSEEVYEGTGGDLPPLNLEE
jgi:hypothetical protein